MARVQALAFDLLKQAEELRRSSHLKSKRSNMVKCLVREDEKRRVATLLNDIIEEAAQ